MTRYDRTLFVVNDVPYISSKSDIPDPEAIRTLHGLLGEGSQAIIFARRQLGDTTTEELHCWTNRFGDQLDRFYRDQARPDIAVVRGTLHPSFFPSSRTGPWLTTPNAYGTQCDDYGRTATPIRIYSRDRWFSRFPNEQTTYQQYGTLIGLLTEARVLYLDPSPHHFRLRLHYWAIYSGMRSDVYRQIIQVQRWEGTEPVIEEDDIAHIWGSPPGH